MNISIAKVRIVDVSCVEEVFPTEEDSADNYWLKVPKLCGALIRVLFLCRISSFFWRPTPHLVAKQVQSQASHMSVCQNNITFGSLS